MSSKFSNTLLVVDPDPANDGDLTKTKVVGRILLNALPSTKADDQIIGNAGMGGQGVLPVPNVYNGWVQNLPPIFQGQLTPSQRNPFPEH